MDDLKRSVEGLLFASERPLGAEEIRKAFEATPSLEDVKAALEALRAEYEEQARGFRLFEIAGGWQLVTDPALEPVLKKFYEGRLKRRLSQATLETLSIVAYRQPVTRADVEAIRGVNSDAAFQTLLGKGLVKIIGKKEVPGRPMLYGTTQVFLEHFGLKAVKDLPSLTEFSLKDIDPNLLPPEMREAADGVPVSEGETAPEGEAAPAAAEGETSEGAENR